MTESSICRLCLEACKKYKSLYDENGRANQLYEMTYKYFHHTIVNMDQAKHLTVICVQCWRHIRDFHNFKLSILVAQAQLGDVVAIEEVVIKTELEQFSVRIDHSTPSELINEGSANPFISSVVKTEVMSADDMPNDPHIQPANEIIVDTAIVKEDNDFMSLPDLELIDVRGDNPDSLCEKKFDPSQGHSTVHFDADPVTVANESVVEEMQLEIAEVVHLNPQIKPPFRKKYASIRKKRLQQLDLQITKSKKKIKCVVCKETFSKYDEYRKHFLQHHRNDVFYVSCCNRKLVKLELIEDHFILHNEPNAFNCKICNKRHKTSDAQRKHLDTYHCKVQVMCKICRKFFKTEVHLNDHYIKSHGISLRFKDEDQADGPPVYKCSECAHIAYSDKEFRAHVCKAHRCLFCSSSFRYFRTLRKHIGTHKGRVVYTCSVCPTMFSDSSAFSLHRKHSHGYKEDGDEETPENLT